TSRAAETDRDQLAHGCRRNRTWGRGPRSRCRPRRAKTPWTADETPSTIPLTDHSGERPMPNYYRHILSQSRGLAALATLLVSDKRGSGVGPVPGALHEALLPAPTDALIDDFVRFCGGEP